MMIHIYTTNKQPATKFKIDVADIDHHYVECDPDKQLWASCCRKKRSAKDCVVQVYYDCIMTWCADGCGCKDPEFIRKKKECEFKNRSDGQKKRRQRERDLA